jgi:hypothetical protein
VPEGGWSALAGGGAGVAAAAGGFCAGESCAIATTGKKKTSQTHRNKPRKRAAFRNPCPLKFVIRLITNRRPLRNPRAPPEASPYIAEELKPPPAYSDATPTSIPANYCVGCGRMERMGSNAG